MADETIIREFSDTARIIEECQRRISRLIEQEIEQATNEARNTAREEVKGEAVGLIAEARRRAEEIIFEANQAAERIVTRAKDRAQAELDQTARRQAMSDPSPGVVPPPFVGTDTDLSQHGRMPVFWA